MSCKLKISNESTKLVSSEANKVEYEKADLSQASDSTLTELGHLVPMYEELIHTSKVHLLQSIVSSILVEMVFNAYYVGLSEEDTRHFQQMEQLLTFLCCLSLLFLCFLFLVLSSSTYML